MPKGVEVGYRGGFLNGSEISQDLGRIFLKGTVLDPDAQIQQAGIDLTLARVVKQPWDKVLPFESDGWVKLNPGRYWVEFNEIPASDELDYLFHLWPRSTHFRGGNLLAVGLGKVAGSKDGIMGASIDVNNKYGLWLERGARICQATVESSTRVFVTPHYVKANSAPLIVDRIFRYTGEARLGVSDRSVEMVELEEGIARLGAGESYLVRFRETIHVAENELVTSLKDNPFPFLWAMGAVADPGYFGRLHACCSSLQPHDIRVGMPMLQLRKDLITPVVSKELYAGKYQGLGSSIDEPETVQWYHPADPQGWVQARDMAPL